MHRTILYLCFCICSFFCFVAFHVCAVDVVLVVVVVVVVVVAVSVFLAAAHVFVCVVFEVLFVAVDAHALYVPALLIGFGGIWDIHFILGGMLLQS